MLGEVCETAVVVELWVRERERLDAQDLAAAQEGCDQPLAGVETARHAAAVDHDGAAAARQLDDGGVTLPDR